MFGGFQEKSEILSYVSYCRIKTHGHFDEDFHGAVSLIALFLRSFLLFTFLSTCNFIWEFVLLFYCIGCFAQVFVVLPAAVSEGY